MISVISILLVIPLLLVLQAAYNVFLHPVSKYPGPLFWRISRLPYCYHAINGSLPQTVRQIHARYGPTVRIAPDELSFTQPEAWRDIYAARDARGRQLEKTKFFYPPEPPEAKMPGNLLLADDERHEMLRKHLAPASTGRAIQDMEPVLQKYTDELMRQFRVVCGKNEGPQNMHRWFSWLTTDVITELAYGESFESVRKRQHHRWTGFVLTTLRAAMISNSLARFGLSGLLRVLMPARIKVMIQEHYQGIVSTVRRRLERGEMGQKDFLTLLQREQKKEGHVHVMEVLDMASASNILVGAGGETTSTLLTVTTFYLLRNLDKLKVLVDTVRGTFPTQEQITLKEVAKLQYLDAVIEEALRMWPPALVPPRVSPPEGISIAGNLIPRGTYIGVDNWTNSHAENNFTKADQFIPERWIHNAKGFENDRRDAINAFSFGPRNCIGKPLAYAEARLTMAKILFNFDLELIGDYDDWEAQAKYWLVWDLKTSCGEVVAKNMSKPVRFKSCHPCS